MAVGTTMKNSIKIVYVFYSLIMYRSFAGVHAIIDSILCNRVYTIYDAVECKNG